MFRWIVAFVMLKWVQFGFFLKLVILQFVVIFLNKPIYRCKRSSRSFLLGRFGVYMCVCFFFAGYVKLCCILFYSQGYRYLSQVWTWCSAVLVISAPSFGLCNCHYCHLSRCGPSCQFPGKSTWVTEIFRPFFTWCESSVFHDGLY